MAYLTEEKKIITGNIKQFEDRLNSQYTRFLEKTPSFVTYYQLNNVESTVDNGLGQVERFLDKNSPLRFSRINDFPIYGVEQIMLDLTLEEHGLDTSFDGEATIIPNTIKPKPYDFFVIDYVSKKFVFMVNSISYDTIKSNNYYRITFNLKSVDGEDIDDLARQTTDSYTCIFTNIGTEQKYLIHDDDLMILENLDTIYTRMVDLYKIFFYNKKYNTFLFTESGTLVTYYDRYLNFFSNKFELFNQKNNFDTLYLHMEQIDAAFMMEYHNSIYQAIEMESKKHVKFQLCNPHAIKPFSSIFTLHRDRNSRIITLNDGNVPYVDSVTIQKIIDNRVEDDDDIITTLIVKYFNKQIKGLSDLSIEKLNDFTSFMDKSMKTFVLIPLILYVLRSQYNKFMTVK